MKKMFVALASLVLGSAAMAETVTLKHEGLELRANLETSGENWQQAPVLLMTHGTLAHNEMEIMQALQETFLERGVSSLAINLSLGLNDRQGMYDCAVPHTHKHTDAVKENALWLDWLKTQGVKEVVLLGHSRGGNQSARFALEHDSAAIKGAILIAPQTWSEGSEAKDYEKRYGKALAPLLNKAEKLVAEGKGETMLKPVDFIYCEDTAASAEAFISYYRTDPLMDTPTVAGKLKMPVLVIAGSADTVVADLPERMEKLADGERVQFELLDGADHFFRDLWAEDIADMGSDFIEGL